MLRWQMDDGMQAAQAPDEVGLEPRPSGSRNQEQA